MTSVLRHLALILCAVALLLPALPSSDARAGKPAARRKKKTAKRTKKTGKPRPAPAPRAGPAGVAKPGTPAPGAAGPATPETGAPGTDPAATAPADPKAAARAQAVELLKQGNKRLDEGLYYDALNFFRKAYSIYPSPKLHFNIAQAYNELKRHLDALNHYELFVKGFKQTENKAMWELANKRIFILQGKIATMQFQVNVGGAGVTVDGKPVGSTPLKKALRFMPGYHAIVITKPGYDKQVIQTKLEPGQHLVKRVKLLTEQEALAKRREVQRIQAEKRFVQERLRREQEAARKQARMRRNAFRISGWTGLGTGVALAVVGMVMGIMSGVEAKKVEDANTESYWRDVKPHYDRCAEYRTATYYTLGFGAALAVAGGVLLGLSYRRQESPEADDARSAAQSRPAKPDIAIVPAIGPRQTGVSLTLRF